MLIAYLQGNANLFMSGIPTTEPLVHRNYKIALLIMSPNIQTASCILLDACF